MQCYGHLVAGPSLPVTWCPPPLHPCANPHPLLMHACMGLGTVSRSGQVLAPLVGLLGDTGNCDGDYRVGMTGVRWHGK